MMQGRESSTRPRKTLRGAEGTNSFEIGLRKN